MILSVCLVAAAAASPPGLLGDAMAYVAKQAARTNGLHPNRSCYPDRVITPPTESPSDPAQWNEAHG